MKRNFGILMHISSLPGKYSIGSFGKEALEFIDFLSDCGFSYWQTLPMCPADDCNSPYKSYSAFAGNPYFVDLEGLYEQGLLTEDELVSAEQNTPYSCEYERLREERLELLRAASKRVELELESEIDSFIADKPELEKFCRFMAIKAAKNESAWYEWDDEEYDLEEYRLWKFIQYEFFTQWEKIRKYANEKGVKIIGDIPIYVAHDSCDVWGNREQFDLDADGMPNSVAGCPPDYFSEDGQLWGNPLYNWDRMKKDNYSWWRERMKHMLYMFDGVRIDHFRGFESYWSIPASAETAKEGKWKKGPGKAFVRVLQEVAGDEALIIAEDLGEITDKVRELVEYSGFPGMRVFQFAFLGDTNSPHLPHNYIENCVAYTGTHDNNTLLGHVFEMDEGTRRRALAYCGYEGWEWNDRRAYEAVLRALLASSAGLVIFPIQDVLYYGADTRMNIPGNPLGNWRFRVTSSQLDEIDRGRMKYLGELYSR